MAHSRSRNPILEINGSPLEEWEMLLSRLRRIPRRCQGFPDRLRHPPGRDAGDSQSLMQRQHGSSQGHIGGEQVNRQHPGPQLGLVLSQEGPLADAVVPFAVLAPVAHGHLARIPGSVAVPAVGAASGTPELALPADGGQPLFGGFLVGESLE